MLRHEQAQMGAKIARAVSMAESVVSRSTMSTPVSERRKHGGDGNKQRRKTQQMTLQMQTRRTLLNYSARPPRPTLATSKEHCALSWRRMKSKTIASTSSNSFRLGQAQRQVAPTRRMKSMPKVKISKRLSLGNALVYTFVRTFLSQIVIAFVCDKKMYNGKYLTASWIRSHSTVVAHKHSRSMGRSTSSHSCSVSCRW